MISPDTLPRDARTLQRLLEERVSCRAFRPDPLPQSLIKQILVMAQRTASWCNTQPWHVVVTAGEGTERLRKALQACAEEPAAPDFDWPAHYDEPYDQRRREGARVYYRACGVAPGDRAAARQVGLRNYTCFDAPHVAIVSTPACLGHYGAIDCGAYVSQFMLAAQSLGVACVAQAALAARPEVIRQHFGLPADRRIVCGISFGRSDPSHPAHRVRTPRAPLSQSVVWID